jgi:hypothetical protein
MQSLNESDASISSFFPKVRGLLEEFKQFYRCFWQMKQASMLKNMVFSIVAKVATESKNTF